MRQLIAAITTAACVCVPVLAFAASDPPPGTGIAPSAIPNDAISDSTIGKAGAALHDVAKLQQRYQVRMDSASPEQKKNLSTQANTEAVKAIQSHGLSVQEYSNVVRTAQNNPQIKRRLLDEAGKAP